MSILEGPAVPWAVLSIQVLGIVSACLARFSEGCTGQKACRWLFFFCLALVAGSVVVSLQLDPECWMSSATVLALMVLMATFQFGRSREAVAW